MSEKFKYKDTIEFPSTPAQIGEHISRMLGVLGLARIHGWTLGKGENHISIEFEYYYPNDNIKYE